MPRHLRVFISSPGDVVAERQRAHEILRDLAEEPAWVGKISIEVVRWDNPRSPTPMYANYTPQQAINLGLPGPSACDIFVLILWARFGTPLSEPLKEDGSRYLSGSEWEFSDVLVSKVPILIYRRSEEPTVSLRDTQFIEKKKQLELVDAFFDRFKGRDGSLGAGYTEYENVAGFEHQFKGTVEQVIRYLVERPDHSELERMLMTKTFSEPIAEVPDQNWLDRVTAILLVRQTLREHRNTLLHLSHAPGVEVALTRYDELLAELEVYAMGCKLLARHTFAVNERGRLVLPRDLEMPIENSRQRVKALAHEVASLLRSR